MRILVVDDDRAVRESLRRSLAFNGYQVDLASDGKDALEAVQQRRPDAMVLDVMMPRLDGLEVCRRMREAGDELPILVLTARDAVSDRVAGLDAGADDYLPKPFALEELLARLRALLRRRTVDDAAASEGTVLQFADLSRGGVVDGAAPQQRAEPGQQLLERERLGQVVVGPGVEPGDPVRDGVARGEHEDRQLVAGLAHPPAHLEPVQPGHHHVEHHRVGPPLLHGLQGVLAVRREIHLVAVERERAP